MTHRLIDNFRSAARTLVAAMRAGTAVDGGSLPQRQDLDTLGIDPRAFRKLGR
jgi:hypothetical protein